MFRRRRKHFDLRVNTLAETHLDVERSRSPADYDRKAKAKATFTYIEESDDIMTGQGKSRNKQGLQGISITEEPQTSFPRLRRQKAKNIT